MADPDDLTHEFTVADDDPRAHRGALSLGFAVDARPLAVGYSHALGVAFDRAVADEHARALGFADADAALAHEQRVAVARLHERSAHTVDVARADYDPRFLRDLARLAGYTRRARFAGRDYAVRPDGRTFLLDERRAVRQHTAPRRDR